jgi:hypothetical protein
MEGAPNASSAGVGGFLAVALIRISAPKPFGSVCKADSKARDNPEASAEDPAFDFSSGVGWVRRISSRNESGGEANLKRTLNKSDAKQTKGKIQ